MNIYDKLIEKLEEAKKASTMDNAGFGFPNDRIRIESKQFSDPNTGSVGDLIHPTTYVKAITQLYRGTWITAPLEEALVILRTNRCVIEDTQKLINTIDSLDLNLIERIKAGRSK